MLEALQQLQFSVCLLSQEGRGERLRDLLDGDVLIRKLVSRGAK